MTVVRPTEPGFIQTYRNDEADYPLEVHGVSDGEYLRTTLDDPDEVGQLIWDWLEGDRQRLDAVPWERTALPTW
ncbi:hypothetical protein [Nocardia sp. NPDC057353]|uniref:hypothetical protein n=1 Tax=Nocardia sp. NPDC057353 TaxID=3346104 RepID=UPI00362D2EB2